MKTFKVFLKNGIILTATSLFLRLVGIIFNTYISNAVGAEGMGVYSLVQSVFGFGVTFACSGINLGATRLVSEALAKDNYKEIKKSVRVCVCYSLLFSGIACISLFCGAEYIGTVFLKDTRTVKSLRMLALALPFISLSSVFSGYFSAMRRVYKNALVMISEQFVRITVTVRLVSLYPFKSVEYACVGVALGTIISEFGALVFNLILLYFDYRKILDKKEKPCSGISKKLAGISLPLALSTYIRSGLVTVEHLLIPFGLRKNGASYSLSMSTYGIVQGMVLPLILFPSCIIYSFSGLLVPEIAAMKERQEYEKINKAVSNVIKYALYFSIGVAGILMCYSYELSMIFYNSSEAYEYIWLFAPLVTVMYLDGAIDGILKGLNEQLHSMKINIADALISVLLVYYLVPLLGVKGYIIAVFVSEIFNCSMSLIRLVKICSPGISISKFVVKPIISAIVSIGLVVFLFNNFNITFLGSGLNLAFRIACTAGVYLIILFHKTKIKLGV